jgi:hypothetical protein
MIIKLIPENDAEKARTPEFELSGVNEFLIMGNQVDEDGTQTDFHEWNGSYRYLFGSLNYYSEVLNDERRDAIARRAMVNTVSPQLKVVPPESEVIDVDSETPTPFVSSDENASESSGDSKKK